MIVVTGKGWPLNHHFIFDLTAIIILFIILLSLTLPKSSEKKRLQPTVKPTVDHSNSDTVINMVNR